MIELLRNRLAVPMCILFFAPAIAQGRDNFLVIVADDLGVDAVSTYAEGAAPVFTENINQLALDGILFRNAYTNAKCAPTRAQALTGRHAFRTGIGTPGGAVLGLAETTIPEILAATHQNAAIGKWHIGGGDIDHPIDSGFDYYAGALANISSYTSWDKTTNSSSTTGSTQTGFTDYTTTDNADEAIAKIAEFDEAQWFVWLAFTAPHSPFHVPPSTLTDITVLPGSDNTTKYKGAVQAMDKEIGRVLASIPPAILADTTIIFLGDNGTPTGVSESPFESNHAKGTMYEGGVNVPFIVVSPRIALADQGTESSALVGAVDIFATLAEIAGVAASTPDSVSIVPYLEDPTLATLPSREFTYAESFQPNGSGPYTSEERAIRDGTFKLIWRDGTYEELYNLDDDEFETANLLPVSGLTSVELAAYDSLVAAMESRDAPVCPSAPDSACLTGFEKGRLLWKDKGGDGDKVVARLVKGPAITQSDLGDPLSIGGTSYAFCLYDDTGTIVARNGVARAGESCDGRDCWDSIGDPPPDGKGYKYRDKLLASDGVKKIVFRAGDAGKSKLIFKGKGAALPDGVTAALTGTTSATMQFRGSDAAQCVSATVSEILTQDPDQFKAK